MTFQAKAGLKFLHLIKRNLRARGFRTLATLISVAILIGVIFGGSIFYSGIEHSINEGAARIGADLLVTKQEDDPAFRFLRLSMPTQEVILLGPLVRSYMSEEAESKVAALEGVIEVAPQLYVGELKDLSHYVEVNAPIVAIDPEKDFTVRLWLKNSLQEALDGHGLVAGALTPFEIGDKLSLDEMTFTVRDKLEVSGAGMDNMIFISIKAAYELSDKASNEKTLSFYRGQISSLLVNTDPSVPPEKIARAIQDIYQRPRSDVPLLSVAGRAEVTTYVMTAISGLITYITMLGAATWVMTAILISSVFAMTVNERRREIGIFRALGATMGFTFNLIIVEALILAILGGILGVLGGGFLLFSLSPSITELLGIPYLLPTPWTIFQNIGLSMSVAVGTALIAAIYPAFLSIRIDPYDAIRTGE